MKGEEDWDDAYTNGRYIRGAAAFPALWAERAEAFRQRMLQSDRTRLDLAYGSRPRNRYDLFLPETSPKGLFVFVHGGYWLDFDKSSWSWLAEGLVKQGWAAALPSYTLAPEARLHEITQEIARAIEVMAKTIAGPVRLAGHSAGGQLVTRMVCAQSPLAPDVANRIDYCLSISGLHDLRSLMNTSMNKDLRLDENEALAESAALQVPLPHVHVRARVGDSERPEFLRQSELLIDAWKGKSAGAYLEMVPYTHHFDIIDDLADPDSALTANLATFRGIK